jgi:haloacetate dehalogenase
LTKNVTQVSINQQIFPLIPERFLSELPEPPQTKAVYEQVSMALATAYFHWYFLIQPRRLPERLIAGDPALWLRTVFGKLGADSSTFGDGVITEYLRTFGTPEGIHATWEDYRAGASVDIANDCADVTAGRKITCPTLILWGARGVVGRLASHPGCHVRKNAVSA